MEALERAEALAASVVLIFLASVELVARELELQVAEEEVLGLGGPSSFMEEVFLSLRTASVFLTILQLPGLAVRQRQAALLEAMDPLLDKIFLFGQEAV